MARDRRTLWPMVLTVLALTSALAFAYYGVRCLVSPVLIAEYERYGMPHVRLWVGSLEILGAVGLLVGFVFAPLGAAAALGLAVLMVLGLGLRVGLRDTVAQMMPALLLAVINGVLVALFLRA